MSFSSKLFSSTWTNSDLTNTTGLTLDFRHCFLRRTRSCLASAFLKLGSVLQLFHDRIALFVCYDRFLAVLGHTTRVDDVTVFENIGFPVDVSINNDSLVSSIGFCMLYLHGVYIIFRCNHTHLRSWMPKLFYIKNSRRDRQMKNNGLFSSLSRI